MTTDENPVPTARRSTGRIAIAKAYREVSIDYAADETEFMLAIDQYKRDHRRPFPTWSEVLSVVLALGYRKDDESES